MTIASSAYTTIDETSKLYALKNARRRQAIKEHEINGQHIISLFLKFDRDAFYALVEIERVKMGELR